MKIRTTCDMTPSRFEVLIIVWARVYSKPFGDAIVVYSFFTCECDESSSVCMTRGGVSPSITADDDVSSVP